MSFSSKYYFVLGIKETASISDVKKAYRTLAKKYHPDKNKEADARERFIEVNEAYEYIVNKPKAPARGKMRSEAYYAHKEKVYKEWVKRNEARVKAKAKRAAEMKYNDWEKMDLRSATMFDFLSTLVFIVVLAIAIPIILGLLEDSIYEEYLVPIFAVLAFISVPAFAYFLTWKDYKIGDILKKKDQIK